jgi:hypothetical protein
VLGKFSARSASYAVIGDFMKRFILTMSALAFLSGVSSMLEAEEAGTSDADQLELGAFVADEVDKGSTGKELAAKIEAKHDELQKHHAEGGKKKHNTSEGADHLGLGESDCKGIGKFVQQQLDKGLHGEALAKAIDQELAARKAAKHGAGHGKDGEPGKNGKPDAGNGDAHGRKAHGNDK